MSIPIKYHHTKTINDEKQKKKAVGDFPPHEPDPFGQWLL
jgi:hypothetical protein